MPAYKAAVHPDMLWTWEDEYADPDHVPTHLLMGTSYLGIDELSNWPCYWTADAAIASVGKSAEEMRRQLLARFR
ncbi:hypothetical protein NL676_004322 [Syzygium grande]|nr:hypothetical protein NL676_004322 [Syzygium grande]